ncbi:MAG: class I poly(R)-hydroxyalkanoic acid synthase [Zoogloeaceae bacterium]|jgi:polyhydroxyalkanoate synthase|nr:class I poly(R)-hydroxyalkanoic acid synthase [Zoogloeaceae bacterium]
MSQSHENGASSFFHPMFQQVFEASQSIIQGFAAFLQKLPQTPGFKSSALPFPQLALPSVPVEDLQELQREFMHQQGQLWQSMLAKSQGREATFRVEPEPGDRRFSAPEWGESPVYDYIRQSYLLNVRFLKQFVEKARVEDERAREKLRFAARQYVDAFSPANFAATNPEFVRKAIETNGQSIAQGINNLIADLGRGRIMMTDESVFEVGKNLAVTEGAVVYENDLFQLLQYKPLTEKVAKRPLLIVPPCINKYYILDLQPENSWVRFLVQQGHTVFLISWRNPGEEQGHLTWDDYLQDGVINSIGVVQEITGQKEINALGFCIGGTLLASALAVLAAKGKKPVASLTLLTTFLDFSDTGEIGLFIDEASLDKQDETIGQGGLLKAQELQSTFSVLRPNDLIWNYVTNNYLKGQKPQAFDLLYWNSDSTGLPGPFACWYMRKMYHENSLKAPNKLTMCGAKVDLGRLDMPVYLFAAREDHIVPWHSSYLSTRLLSGKRRFVLGASGHIAGVINPAAKNRRSYWTNENLEADAKEWFATAEERPGSWWNDWAAWAKEFSGGEIAAPKALGSEQRKPIEPAPGRYVKVRAV